MIKSLDKEIITKSYDNCALDPGSRSFQTIFSEEKVVQIKHDKEN